MRFEIKNRIIQINENSLLVGDNADYIAVFVFDEEWEGKVKTARFIGRSGFVDVLLENDRCIIPVETLKAGLIRVGVFSGEMTSTYCEPYIRESIKETIGAPAAPAEDVYAQIIQRLENMGSSNTGNAEKVFFTEENGRLYANMPDGNSGYNFSMSEDGRLEVTYQ